MSEEQDDHGSVPEPPSAKRSCLDMATPSGPATSGTGMQTSYPRMVGDNRIVFGTDEANYDEFDALIVSQNNNNHGAEPEEGEIKLTYRGCVDLKCQ